MLGWIKHKLESSLLGEICIRYADDTTFLAESKEDLKSPLMKVKEESEKVVLRLNIQKTKIMVSSSITVAKACSVAQSCQTLCDPMNCSPPVTCVHGSFQTRILELVAISFPWQIEGEKVEAVMDFPFLDSKITVDGA